MQESLHWNGGSILLLKMKLKEAMFPRCTRLYFFPQQGDEVLKCLPQNIAGAESLEFKTVWSS